MNIQWLLPSENKLFVQSTAKDADGQECYTSEELSVHLTVRDIQQWKTNSELGKSSSQRRHRPRKGHTPLFPQTNVMKSSSFPAPQQPRMSADLPPRAVLSAAPASPPTGKEDRVRIWLSRSLAVIYGQGWSNHLWSRLLGTFEKPLLPQTCVHTDYYTSGFLLLICR